MTGFRQYLPSNQHEEAEVEQRQQRPPVLIVEVLEVGKVPGRILVVVLAHLGEPQPGQQLRAEHGPGLWEVRGLAFTPPETVIERKWGLLLRDIANKGSIKPHMYMFAA